MGRESSVWGMIALPGESAMAHEIVVYGIAISIIFAFVRYAVPAMPKSIAWAGVAAGIALLLADMLAPQMKLSIPVIVLFLTGVLLIGAAVHLSLRPSEKQPAAIAAVPAVRTAFSSTQIISVLPPSLGGNSILRLDNIAVLRLSV